MGSTPRHEWIPPAFAELDDLPDSQSAVLELTEEERRQLEALGYVDGGP